MMHNVNNNQVYRLNSGSSLPSAANAGENSYKPHVLWNHSSLATLLSLTVKAHVHPVMHGQLREPEHTYVKRAVRKAHFKLNRAFKVIQGPPDWCRQISRTVCPRNVQLMPTLFLKLATGKLQIRRFQPANSCKKMPSDFYKWLYC